MQFAEAKRSVDQMIEDDRLILAANYAQNGIYRAVVHAFLFHIHHQTFNVFGLLFFSFGIMDKMKFVGLA